MSDTGNGQRRTSGQRCPSAEAWTRSTPRSTVALIQKSAGLPWNGPVAQSDRPTVRTVLSRVLPSNTSIPSLDPGLFVNEDHEAGLIVQLFVLRPDPQGRGKAALDARPEQMAGVPDEAVMRLTPEIGGVVGDDIETFWPQLPTSRLICPSTAIQHGKTTTETTNPIMPSSIRRRTAIVETGRLQNLRIMSRLGGSTHVPHRSASPQKLRAAAGNRFEPRLSEA